MGLCRLTRQVLSEFLPARILSLGWPNSIELIDLKGSELTTIDIVAHHGNEVLRDLCDPAPLGLGRFDVVLDHGTIEHCANPAQAFLHAASAVDNGGVIIHHLPITMINHGYWNINPSFILDFYLVNDFEILCFDLTDGNGELLAWPGKIRDEMELPLNCLSLVVACRRTDALVRLPPYETKWEESKIALPMIQKLRQLKTKFNKIRQLN
jgi:hypothetical protein